jgi:hypothetical protein
MSVEEGSLSGGGGRPSARSRTAQQKVRGPSRQACPPRRAPGNDRPAHSRDWWHREALIHRAPPAELELADEAWPTAARAWDMGGCLSAGLEADLSLMAAGPSPPGSHHDRHGASRYRRRFPSRLGGGHLWERRGGRARRATGPTLGRENPWRSPCCLLPSQASLAPAASLDVGRARGDALDRAAGDGYWERPEKSLH